MPRRENLTVMSIRVPSSVMRAIDDVAEGNLETRATAIRRCLRDFASRERCDRQEAGDDVRRVMNGGRQ